MLMALCIDGTSQQTQSLFVQTIFDLATLSFAGTYIYIVNKKRKLGVNFCAEDVNDGPWPG